MKQLPVIASWLLLPFFVEANPARSCKTAAVGSTVSTSSGSISGHAASNRSDVSEYLGIPYAQPPIGQLRFAPPLPFQSTAHFNAASFSSDCPGNPAPPGFFPNATVQAPRIIAFFAGAAGNAQSEDCLTLNVWTKASARKNKPVLVFIYGGRFNVGKTNTPFYNGQYLADSQDVVVVTFNYRVNIFGFPGYPGLPQNVGLLDQRLAVEWVRDNIEGFGGSPQKITIFGQSAGGASVDYWSYAWRNDPIVNGLISESGTALSFNPFLPERAAAAFNNASILLGCRGEADVLSCVRSKNTTEVLAAIARIPPQPSQALPVPIFQPTVDNVTVFSNYSTLSAQGAFARIPYLAGSNDYEFGYYAVAAFALNRSFTPAQVDLFNLQGFTCPTAREVAARSAQGVSAWRYRYFGDWPNLRLYPGSGAYHGSELEMVFGTAQDVSGLPNSDTENLFSAYMMTVWATFADDPQEGLSSCLGWPKYDPNEPTLARLAYNNETQASFVFPIVYDGQCAALGNEVADAEGAF